MLSSLTLCDETHFKTNNMAFLILFLLNIIYHVFNCILKGKEFPTMAQKIEPHMIRAQGLQIKPISSFNLYCFSLGWIYTPWTNYVTTLSSFWSVQSYPRFLSYNYVFSQSVSIIVKLFKLYDMIYIKFFIRTAELYWVKNNNYIFIISLKSWSLFCCNMYMFQKSTLFPRAKKENFRIFFSYSSSFYYFPFSSIIIFLAE